MARLSPCMPETNTLYTIPRAHAASCCSLRVRAPAPPGWKLASTMVDELLTSFTACALACGLASPSARQLMSSQAAANRARARSACATLLRYAGRLLALEAGSRRLDGGAVPGESAGRGADCAPKGADGRESGGQPGRQPLSRGLTRPGGHEEGSARLGSALILYRLQHLQGRAHSKTSPYHSTDCRRGCRRAGPEPCDREPVHAAGRVRREANTCPTEPLAHGA